MFNSSCKNEYENKKNCCCNSNENSNSNCNKYNENCMLIKVCSYDKGCNPKYEY